jgi:hypothetical protein
LAIPKEMGSKPTDDNEAERLTVFRCVLGSVRREGWVLQQGGGMAVGAAAARRAANKRKGPPVSSSRDQARVAANRQRIAVRPARRGSPAQLGVDGKRC